MAIELSRTKIERAFPRVKSGLDKYLWLQTHRDTADVRSDREYSKRFNNFYRVRRGPAWREKFYELLESRSTTR